MKKNLLMLLNKCRLQGIRLVIEPSMLSFADEELGGAKGMAQFIKTREFSNLNIGFAMDEGITSPNDEFILSYTERSICRNTHETRVLFYLVKTPENEIHFHLFL
jgi:hypothetical protein